MTTPPLRTETKSLTIASVEHKMTKNGDPCIRLTVQPVEGRQFNYPVAVWAWDTSVLPDNVAPNQVYLMNLEARRTRESKPDDGVFWNYDWSLVGVGQGQPQQTPTERVLLRTSKETHPPYTQTPAASPQPTAWDFEAIKRESFHRQAALKEATEMTRWFYGDERPQAVPLAESVSYFLKHFFDLLQRETTKATEDHDEWVVPDAPPEFEDYQGEPQ